MDHAVGGGWIQGTYFPGLPSIIGLAFYNSCSDWIVSFCMFGQLDRKNGFREIRHLLISAPSDSQHWIGHSSFVGLGRQGSAELDAARRSFVSTMQICG